MSTDHRAAAERWLALAESEYDQGRTEKAHAASRISVGHAALHDIDVGSFDVMPQLPTSAAVRATRVESGGQL